MNRNGPPECPVNNHKTPITTLKPISLDPQQRLRVLIRKPDVQSHSNQKKSNFPDTDYCFEH